MYLIHVVCSIFAFVITFCAKQKKKRGRLIIQTGSDRLSVKVILHGDTYAPLLF